MAGYRIISSDDHVYEPADLWTTRVEPKFRDRAPRVVRTEDGSDWWYCDGMKGISAATGSQVGMRFEEPEKLGFDFKLEDVRRGGYIPEERIKDLDADGIDVCINYPTSGLVLYSLPDSELLTSLFKAYNDWLAEFCKPFPGRIKGVAMLNADDVPSAVQELGRCAKMGLIGATISMYPSEERSYQSPEYEPLWAAAQDLRMPLSLHIGTNRPGPGQQFADLAKMPPGWFANVDHWVRVSISHMIFSGVFERYPKLQVGSIEMETGWIPHLMNTIDYIYTQKSTRFAPHRLRRICFPATITAVTCSPAFRKMLWA